MWSRVCHVARTKLNYYNLEEAVRNKMLFVDVVNFGSDFQVFRDSPIVLA